MNASVPQGSTLGPLLFLVFINRTPLSSNPRFFTDDTSLLSVVHDKIHRQIN